uniref:F-box domain-containing protein n=1 Tax=Oryza sativa subsp. japonica TaxID=39947 RepID=Q7G5H1_ORYSJ|nr:hypothetical protein LOC_Os10g03680 [Oryza sativa Japonica Group]
MAGTPGKRLRYTASRRVGSTLSDLPEGVLHHIMSFLDSRQAVQICSQAWDANNRKFCHIIGITNIPSSYFGRALLLHDSERLPDLYHCTQ